MAGVGHRVMDGVSTNACRREAALPADATITLITISIDEKAEQLWASPSRRYVVEYTQVEATEGVCVFADSLVGSREGASEVDEDDVKPIRPECCSRGSTKGATRVRCGT